jgi:hypothetical protein
MKTLELWACSLDQPPSQQTHDRVERIGHLTYDLNRFELDRFQQREDHRGDTVGEMYYLDYYIDILLGDEEGTLKVQARAFERIMGEASIQYSARTQPTLQMNGEECPICLSAIAEPTNIACGHKFCMRCKYS